MIPRIKSSPFFALLCLLCIASGNITTFLIYMLAVISHECAHCVMADMLGYEVCSIELMPYGCRAEIVGIGQPFGRISDSSCWTCIQPYRIYGDKGDGT